MPIRPELRQFYQEHWLNVIRPRILARAGYKCEKCKKPDGRYINTITGRRLHAWPRPRIEPVMFWSLAKPDELEPAPAWRNHRGEIDDTLWSKGMLMFQTKDRATLQLRAMRRTFAQIGVAHGNNQAGDDRDENLFAWCTWCHLIHDAEHHHATRSTRKDAARPLLILASEIEKGDQRDAGRPVLSLHLSQSGGPVNLVSVA
jgi:hypothetical protein